ncbi:MAG: hypothetical protein HQ580_01810 [Planctomycetes bacterium]|nr:hypothetical protein [Planctomycetota bacterium]
MKRLIVTIIVAILTISLSGCTFVREFRRGRPHHEVIVTRPVHPPVRYERRHRPYAQRQFERRHNPGPRRMHD